MAKTIGAKIAKLFSVLVSAAVLFTCTLMFAACESKYPEIEMNISFNGETYTLTYKLYRNAYEQTVEHYLELIDMGYFDNTVIHDYQSDRMVGGGYTYEDIENGDITDDLTALDYDAATLNEDGSVKIPVSVWADEARTQATNRLYGEISNNNGFSLNNFSGLSNTTGAIGTYSYTSSGEKDYVYITRPSGTEVTGQYYKNSVTSMFFLATSSSAASSSDYCVFGELADSDSVTTFSDLTTAISDYITAQQESNDSYSFTETFDTEIEDSMANESPYDVTFNVPKVKIIIRSVEVTKY